jgi:hypothetical protein
MNQFLPFHLDKEQLKMSESECKNATFSLLSLYLIGKKLIKLYKSISIVKPKISKEFPDFN